MSDSRGLRPHQVIGYEYVPPNLLVNGGFEIWQRGAGPFTNGAGGSAYGPFTADEWLVNKGGVYADTVTVTRDSANAKTGGYCAQFVKTGSVAPAIFQQGVESWKALQGLTVTFSVWVKTVNLTIVAGIKCWNGSSYPLVASSFHSGSGNWERLTAVAPLPANLVSVPFIGPHSFPLMVEVRENGGSFGGVTFYVDGAILVVGNYPEGVPFVPTNFAEDLRRSQRFYETTYVNMSAYGSTNTWYGCAPLVPKYATPTITATGTVLTGNATGIVPTASTEIAHYGMTRSGVVGDGQVTSTLIAEVVP